MHYTVRTEANRSQFPLLRDPGTMPFRSFLKSEVLPGVQRRFTSMYATVPVVNPPHALQYNIGELLHSR